MKTLQTVVLAIALVTAFSSCQPSSSRTQILSDKGTRAAMMDTIANDSTMSRQMIETMMNGKNGMMMQQHMMGNQNLMMKMLKDNPAMMQSMMSAMMETAKGDTSRMSGMIKTMMGNPQMMQMMQNRTGSSNMNGMGHMNGMHH